MPKAKLTIEKDFDKFEVAAEINDVKIEEHARYGNVDVVVLNFKHPAQLYKTGLMQSLVERPDTPKKEAQKSPGENEVKK